MKIFKDMDGASTHSRGIAQAIVADFFPSFQSHDREAAIRFYGRGAALHFQGQQFEGIDAIRQFFSTLRTFSLHITRADVHSVPSPDGFWSMVIVVGSVEFGDVTATFHSNLCVQANRQDFRAFVRSHSFTWT
jgi:hypothetical protein